MPLEESTTRHVFVDDKLLLMKQCLRDARVIVKGTKGLLADDELSDDGEYMPLVAAITQALFHERSRIPLTQERMQTMMLGAELASASLDEIKSKQEEFNSIVRDVEQKKREVQKLQERVADIKAADFLKVTIGTGNYTYLKKTGSFTFVGTNKTKYTIDSDGNLEKHGFRGWQGNIEFDGEQLPMDDAIAIVYTHIMANSVKFDRDRGCGTIHIRE